MTGSGLALGITTFFCDTLIITRGAHTPTIAIRSAAGSEYLSRTEVSRYFAIMFDAGVAMEDASSSDRDQWDPAREAVTLNRPSMTDCTMTVVAGSDGVFLDEERLLLALVL